MSPNLYSILGVAPDAEPEVVKAAYRALMRKYHPDTSRAPDAAERARSINLAYTILSDPAKRQAYDQSYRHNPHTTHQKKAPTQSRSAPPNWAPPKTPPSPPRSKPKAPKPPIQRTWVEEMGIGPIILAFLVMLGGGAWLATSGILPAWKTISATSRTVSQVPSSLAQAEGIAPSLDSLPKYIAPPAINQADLESGVREATRVLKKDGLYGAKAYSERCHQRAGPHWSKIDQCLAFDQAAMLFEMATPSGYQVPTDGYFQRIKPHSWVRYQAVTDSMVISLERSEQIQSRVEPLFSAAPNL